MATIDEEQPMTDICTTAKGFIKFPSIEQFRHAIADVKYHAEKRGEPLPTLTFRGTVKLHGMHADIVKFADGSYTYQSRNLILGPGKKDVQGFYTNMNAPSKIPVVQSLFDQVSDICGPWTTSIVIAGEWCGGSIQKGVALAKLDKMFVIFAIKVDDTWVDMAAYKDVHDNGSRIYNILQFPTYEVNIDFADPTEAQQTMIKLTDEVDNECPVGKYFGVSGAGEGIVWSTPDSRYVFKTKGEKHMIVEPKESKLPLTAEKMEGIGEFVKSVLTPARLEQGSQYLEEMGMDPRANANIGKFAAWLVEDVFKEELDTMHASKLDPKVVQKQITVQGAAWYKARATGEGQSTAQ